MHGRCVCHIILSRQDEEPTKPHLPAQINPKGWKQKYFLVEQQSLVCFHTLYLSCDSKRSHTDVLVTAAPSIQRSESICVWCFSEDSQYFKSEMSRGSARGLAAGLCVHSNEGLLF